MTETHLTKERFNAWLILCAALAIHIADEALSGFLELYNPTVLSIRHSHPWMIFPTFTFPVWITLLMLGVAGLLILSIWVRRGTFWTPYAAYAFAFLMLSNALAHLGFSIYKKAWMPGAYTSPLILLGSLYLLRTTARRWPCNP
jgi:hypothetical protein